MSDKGVAIRRKVLGSDIFVARTARKDKSLRGATTMPPPHRLVLRD